jgi:methylated-DNA-[protein]-cysteine S-methyltransferase
MATPAPGEPDATPFGAAEPGWVLFETPVGVCALAWTGDLRLAGCLLPDADEARLRQRMARRHGEAERVLPPAEVRRWITRLRAVMAGAPDTLADIALADEALPAFQRRVWALARQIPPGATRSYGELAQDLGEPGAAQAVGRALGANPFAPIVPCHRVLAAHGGAGGFSAPGGTRTKLQLLALEGAPLTPHPDQPSLFPDNRGPA